ncbi:MAG: ATP synthase archaeal subunit H [Methanosarcinaceae archaeon]|nr:ATP synthase archaeal subunit H [Methanosarcinaceae archaeon]
MANNEILSEIKQAEQDAKIAVDAAAERSNSEIAKARSVARQIIDDGEEQSVKSAHEAARKGEAEIAEMRASIIQEGVDASESLAVKSQSNIPKATKYLLGEFEREINA